MDDTTVLTSAVSQETDSSTASATYEFTKWMKLKDCLDYLARRIGTRNPTDNFMQRTFSHIFNNMTNELLAAVLSDHSDPFESVITLIKLDDNSIADNDSISTFTNNPNWQKQIFLIYHQGQQVFAPYVSCNDGVVNVCFDGNDAKVACKNIIDCIAKWNDSIVSKNKHTTNDDGNSAGVDLPASKAIQMRLQLVQQLISRVSDKLDQTKLKNESMQALSDNFDRGNDDEKMNTIVNILATSIENFRMAVPNHHVYTDEVSSMEMEDERVVGGPVDATINVNHSILPNLQDAPAQLNLPETTTINLEKYPAPHISEEPTEYQRCRRFSDLQAGICPMIQAGGKGALQHTHVEIAVPSPDGTNLSLCVGAVTVRRVKHPQKGVVPRKPSIATKEEIEIHGERKCIKGDQGSYDQGAECAYLQITSEERKTGKKELEAHLIRWSQMGAGHKNKNKSDHLSRCKLEFYFCIRTGSNQYKRVSAKSYSRTIEEADGPVTLEEKPGQIRNIDDRGGQVIEFSLSVKCPKSDIGIVCNNKPLSKQNFKIEKKKLFVTTPTKEGNDLHLDLRILRDEYDDASEANISRVLFNGIFKYVSRDTEKALDSRRCDEPEVSSAED